MIEYFKNLFRTPEVLNEYLILKNGHNEYYVKFPGRWRQWLRVDKKHNNYWLDTSFTMADKFMRKEEAELAAIGYIKSISLEEV